MAFISKDKTLMREVWRKAFKSENGVRLTFLNEARAHKARMMLYNAVKAEKQGTSEDGELIAAAESIEVVFGETRNVLWLRDRSKNDIFQAMEQELGVSLKDVVAPDAQESLERMLQLSGLAPTPEPASPAALPDDPVGKTINPFFKR